MKRTIVKAKAAIQCFENAVRAHEMQGAQPPEEREAILTEYEEAKAQLEALCAGITMSFPATKGVNHFPVKTK